MKLKKICKCCGKEFETNNPQKIYCNGEHYLPCPVCGKPVLKTDNDFSRRPACCSNKCRQELRSKHFKKKKCAWCGKMFTPKSGVQIICNDVHYINCEICGKQMIRDIHDEKTTCSKECSDIARKNHNLEKYGVDHPMKTKEVQERFKQSMLKKYGVEHALQRKDISERQQITAYKTNMEHSGVPYACLLPQCMNAQGKIISNVNINFANKLKDAGVVYSLEKRISNYSFDISIESSNTLIEINPTYTHSRIKNHWGTFGDKKYHLEKTKVANDAGYRCIHVFDWDDTDMIVEMLKPKQTIYARKCKIYRLNIDVAVEFLNRYHLQGSCRGQLLCLGLVYENELYQVMTFGKSRYDKKYAVELLRLCTKPGYTIVGGASKLFKFATEDYGLNNIMSYCDLSKFEGKVYEKIGMSLVRQSPPQEVWSRDSEKITANLLRQRGYDQLFGTSYGKGTNNEQLMLENGWLPVYDCGQAVYEYI